MGHQESSPPRKRHRVPHHRRRRHHHHHNSAPQTANRTSSLNLGRLNRESHAPDSHVAVENWLGQLAAPVPTARLLSPETRNQPVHHRKHHRKHPRSKDSHESSGNQRPRHADRSWRPQHIPPTQGFSPPCLPLATNSWRNPKRDKQEGDDSSLISDLSSRRQPKEWASTEATSEHPEVSLYKLLDEAEGATVASSPTSHVGTIEAAFEKRPRHKTRADKYKTKKSKDRKRGGRKRDQDNCQPRGPKSKTRKHIVMRKNVMKNFTSGAVTNDRITVQPNLRPGLFNNKRVPKKQPIADLSFSEMPFPTRHERDIPQQEGLTDSQLRERRRESRELERVSSFFLPTYPDTASHKPKPKKSKRNKETRGNQLVPGDNGWDSSTTSSSPTILTQDHHQFLTSPENSCSVPTVTPSGPEYRPASSKTTYLTWSSSQYSPKARRCLVDTGPEPIEPARSVTPEDIRAALAFTGVYKNTGIHPYDVSDDQQNRSLEALGESSPTRNSTIGRGDTYKGRISTSYHKSKVKSKCANDIGATVARLAHLQQRWNTILPPEWRLQRPLKLEVFAVDKQREILDVPTSAGQLSRQTIARQARAQLTREIAPAHHACDHGNSAPNTNVHHITESPAPVPLERGRAVEDVAFADQKRATIASRDAMPPPPIPPPRFNSLHTTQPKPGDELSTPIETARPSRAHVQLPSFEQLEVMDSYKATGQQCELDGVSEKVFSSLDSVSWIPQAATSNVVSNDQGQTLSALSIRSPIHEIQSKEINLQGPSHLIPPPASHLNENMADFIARIESELDESTSLDEYHQPESSREDRGFSLDSTNTYDMQDRRLTAPGGLRVDRPRLPVGVIDDLEFRDVFETNRNPYEYEELAAYVRDKPTTMSTDGQRDDFDEFQEMSNFWRPNRFARF